MVLSSIGQASPELVQPQSPTTKETNSPQSNWASEAMQKSSTRKWLPSRKLPPCQPTSSKTSPISPTSTSSRTTLQPSTLLLTPNRAPLNYSR